MHPRNLTIHCAIFHRFPKLTMQCGNRTIPEAIDALAAEQPDRVWARYFANSNDFDAGVCQSITFSVLARATDALAWHLNNSIPARPRGSTVLYIGPSDVRYYIVAAAACKCNLKVSTSNAYKYDESNANADSPGALLITQEQQRSTLFTGPATRMSHFLASD
jgi:hypothetical protein